MLKQAARIVLSITLIESLIFTPIVYADDQLSLPSTDLTAPTVVLPPMTKTVPSGSKQTITAKVTDDTGVKTVTLFYREVGAAEYNRMAMQRVKDTDQYNAVIEHVPDKGLEFYIQAEDIAGNSLLHGYSFSPLVLHAEKAAAPAVVGEEPEEAAAPAKTAQASTSEEKPEKEESSKTNWLWIGLGVVAVGALAGGSSSSSSSSTSTSSGGATVTVGAPLP